MKGFLAGALALIALQVVLTTPLAGVAAAIAVPARWAEQWMDPAVPLLPDKSGAKAPAQGPTTRQGEKYLPHTRPKTPGQCPPGYAWNPATGNCDLQPYHITQ